MKKLSAFFFAALLAVVSLASSGCLVKRTMTDFKDHGSKSVMLMETIDTYALGIPAWYYYPQYVHQFWNCVEEGDAVNCAKVCGGANDVQCPVYFVAQY